MADTTKPSTTKSNATKGTDYKFLAPNENTTDCRARVKFQSYSWKSSPPALANSKGPVKGGGGMSATLYLPANFSEDYTAKWSVDDVVTALTQGGKDGKLASGVEALSKAAQTGFGGIVNSAKFATGMTEFPGKFLIFQQGDPIAPSFQFELLPMNAGEAGVIVNMIKDFKKTILPTFTGTVLEFPNIWSIGFSGINGPGFPGLDGYNDMVLTNVKVGYGGGEQSALVFHDKNPTIVTLSLSFMSIKHSYLG